MNEAILYAGIAAAAAAYALPRVVLRLELSRAKHPSLSGHSRIARRIAALIPFYAYPEERFFRTDGAPDRVVALRRCGFDRLARELRERSPRTLHLTGQVEAGI